jgi:hydrogenase maturation protein HypF
VPEAVRIRVSGVVQGVGFRPFVWRHARNLGIVGWVRNDSAGVEIHAEGTAAVLHQLQGCLHEEAPPLARIDAITAQQATPVGLMEFSIIASSTGKLATAIGHDTAPCPACLAELFAPESRRWRHAFITCTHCGPRFTVTYRLPYDRPQTSLSPFPLCPDCQHEYANPADRRFHAETICCPVCGPQLSLLDMEGRPLAGDPIAATLALLQSGKIVAIKGLGGFHLACDAHNPAAVASLRTRKQREEKPFALMIAAVPSAPTAVALGATDAILLASEERPILLVPKLPGADVRLTGIAPGLAELGLMLPATPMQYLLFHEAAGRPTGIDWLNQPQPLILVMTSANPHGEPLVIENDEAMTRLVGIADAFLLHDRAIAVRCDDSVRRVNSMVRRARGFTPKAIKLTRSGTASVMAVGGWYKNTICVTRGNEAFVSQHIGDLDNAATCNFFEETVAHQLHMLDVTPIAVVHDRHPDFHSTRFAARFAAQHCIPALGIQHHHAHIAAVCAEHGIDTPVLGLALDGVGLGSDGTAWGGELLLVDGMHSTRLGHFMPLPLPGGDVAAREPWRMAAAVLHVLGQQEAITRLFAAEPAASTLVQMLARDINCPKTSSAGRYFDAAAGLLNLHRRCSYEGQAAMRLEGLAMSHGPTAPMTGGWHIDAQGILDLRPLLQALATATPVQFAFMASLFHATLARALLDWVERASKETGVTTVVGAGGCFHNRELSATLRTSLYQRELQFIEARVLPPNDGGLSLGQAWIALRQLENN